MIRTGNPALNDQVFTAEPYYGENAMTVQGAVNKTAILLGILITAGTFSWRHIADAQAGAPWLIISLIGGFVLGMVIVFKKTWAPVLSPLYAACQGLLLGAISALFEKQFPGIVIQAVFMTFGTLAALLVAYKSGIIRATENFKLGVVAATGGIALYYLASMIMGFFGVQLPLIHSTGTMGIVFSVVVVIIAALNLVLDFDFIENGAAAGAPKYMEWYAAFGLLVTLVWLYIEILRLLAKLSARRD